MDRLFDMDNGFFRFMGKIFDMLVLNLLTIIMCLPIVTIGPSITAAYYVAMKEVRDEEGYLIKDFFKSFKQNFLQGFILEIILIVAAVIAYVDVRVMYNWTNESTNILINLLFYAIVGFVLVFIIASVYVFPILAKFDNPTKKVLINSVMMSVKHLPNSIFMVVVYIIAGVLVYVNFISLLFVFGAAIFINAIVCRRIFDNYITVDSDGRTVSVGEVKPEQDSDTINIEDKEENVIEDNNENNI